MSPRLALHTAAHRHTWAAVIEKSSERFFSEKEGVFFLMNGNDEGLYGRKRQESSEGNMSKPREAARISLLNRENRPSESAIGQLVAMQHWRPLKHLDGRESMNESEESLEKLQHKHLYIYAEELALHC